MEMALLALLVKEIVPEQRVIQEVSLTRLEKIFPPIFLRLHFQRIAIPPCRYTLA